MATAELARQNAAEAGVDDCIEFRRADIRDLESQGQAGGIIITNPPYGERIGEAKEINIIYKKLNEFFIKNPSNILRDLYTDHS